MKGVPSEHLSPQARERLSSWGGRNSYMDAEFDYIVPEERSETKVYAVRILDFLEKHDGWHPVRGILDAVGREQIRLFDAAISLLFDVVESRICGQRTLYRRNDLRRVPWIDRRNTSFLFTVPRDTTTPVNSMKGKKD